MSITVKLHPAEKFINWFPTNTKLYIRGEKGKDWNNTQKLYSELFQQLKVFFDEYIEKEIEERIAKGK